MIIIIIIKWLTKMKRNPDRWTMYVTTEDLFCIKSITDPRNMHFKTTVFILLFYQFTKRNK